MNRPFYVKEQNIKPSFRFRVHRETTSEGRELFTIQTKRYERTPAWAHVLAHVNGDFGYLPEVFHSSEDAVQRIKQYRDC